MKKIQQLREYLINSIAGLKTNPDTMQIKAMSGNPVCSMGNNLNIEYRYNVELILVDFANDLDLLMIPLLVWISEHQSDLLVNPDKAKTTINFEMDVIDNSKVDIRVTFPLTERHIINNNDGQLNINVPAEPQYQPFWPAQTLELQDQEGSTLVSFQTADQKGAALEMPFPTKR
ncbi:phage tail protein [Acinetobacter populi]|uniref:Phage tail protein n=1 Tax=Acinetobacter populi TaxID=1582270 RepID=A0A1Z9Z2L9_9GAMM|nr:phage tail protein [Acinetobacter populi]OUY08704.1 hypothetical protein CAP51_03575 [Acinetobacter populi]